MNDFICKKEYCTGCFACHSICPKDAIEMKEDSYGNIYPSIKKSKCVQCGLCKKICPQLNEKLNFNFPISAYAMYNKNDELRKESTSGGAATTFYMYILKEGGIVYGASNLYGGNSFNFIRITSIGELYKVKGSKYVHCYTNDTFRQVKNDLNLNKKVLFIGTPCQIAGLKLYLIKNYENLITIDIICHGVPSQKLLFQEIENLGFDYTNINYVSFRDQKGFNFKLIDKDNKVVFEKESSQVPYYQNFLNGSIYRENCYSCKYASKKRISDITIGDFWGLNKNSKVYDDQFKGISLVMAITNKGFELLNNIKKDCIFEERSIEEACKANQQLNHPSLKTKKHYKFIKYYKKFGYEMTMRKMLSSSEKLKNIAKNNKLIYNLYKKIKGLKG